jgi:hypothetical protein
MPRAAPGNSSGRNQSEAIQVRYQPPEGFRVDPHRLSDIERNHQRLALQPLKHFLGWSISKDVGQRILAFSYAGSPTTPSHISLIV